MAATAAESALAIKAAAGWLAADLGLERKEAMFNAAFNTTPTNIASPRWSSPTIALVMEPTILNPPSRFALPAQRAVSRSPSRSPMRRQQLVAHELDPLLSDLSPTSTLKALQSVDTVAEAVPRNSAFRNCVAAASTSERAWGIKAALAGKKVREWYRELEAWPWPTASHDGRNGFEPSTEVLRGGKEEGIEREAEESSWGSLSARTVQKYEERIEEIRDDMETLELEELKDHIRAIHLSTNSRRSMYGQLDASYINGYAHLDDFTAVITATIMQTLPDVSRLNSLLGIWSIRLLVSRQVPGFLDCMEETRIALNSAKKVVGEPGFEDSSSEPAINREAFVTMRGVLEKQILEVGQRLDYMLDALEGREDTVPDSWIDGMEAVEADYEDWVVGTEQKVLESEFRAVVSDKDPDVVAPGQHTRYRPPSTTAADDEGKEVSRDGLDSRAVTTPMDVERLEQSQTGNTAFTPPISPLQRPHIDPPSNGAFEPLMSQAEKSMGADGKIARSRSNSKLTPLNLVKNQSYLEGPVSSDFSSDNSYPGSATSDYFSNMSSPEVQHASRAEYFGAPVEVTSPSLTQKYPESPSEMVSRQSSQRTERGRPMSEDLSSSQGFPSSTGARSRASSFVPEPAILEDGEFAGSGLVDRKDGKTHFKPRSASMQSYEVVSRREIRSVILHRSDSHSATPIAQLRAGEGSSNHSLSLDTKDSKPSRVERPELNEVAPFTGNAELASQGLPSTATTHQLPEGTESPPANRIISGEIHKTPLLSKKTRSRFEDVADAAPGITPVRIRQRRKSDSTSPIKPKSQQSSPLKPGAEQLEARISSILTEIPAHIRLASGPEANAREILQPGFHTYNLGTPAAHQTPPRFTRAQTSAPSPLMTLAPAQPKNYQTRIGGDPEIKLYHLHQAGRDAPIKLFVRLVGEAGERVMVRIGGGWADLGEYLKEYASHHGKRSVSGSRYAFQEVSSSPMTNSPAGLSAPNSRPASSSGLDASTMPMTPEQAAHRFFDATPGSIPSIASLKPGSRHSSSEDDSPLGGAGAKTKQTDISPRKQAWVDGMLDQARKAGMEKSRGHAAEVGDLGKVGGTKRVFLRSKTTG